MGTRSAHMLAGPLYALAAWSAVRGHPVLAGDLPLAEIGRTLAQGITREGGRFDLLTLLDPGVLPVTIALFSALIYIGAFLVVWGTRVAEAPRGERPSTPVLLLVAVVFGHLAGCVSGLAGATDVGYYLASVGGTTFLGVVLLVARRERSPRQPTLMRGGMRRVLAVSGGLVLAVSVRPADTALAWATGAMQVPEIWFPLVKLTALVTPGTVALALLTASCAVVMVVLESRAGGMAWWRRWLLVAPGWILILGPNNAALGLGVAFVTSRLLHAGFPSWARTAFVWIVIAWPVAASLQL